MIITTAYGKLEGVQGNGCQVYKGVPYAKPPVGPLRWRGPERPEPWEGVYQADTFRGRSVQQNRQPGSFYDKEFGSQEVNDVTPSEDCLYLNLWVPENAAGKRLPVAMWIHGGAFLTGCGFEKTFDGSFLAARGVIVVTINYRLGVFGFLAHPLLSQESPNHVSGNYGTLDQIAALTWVRENIAAFGGDPENITVFGQSAGAMSVLNLTASDLTRGMIAKAIVQSGLGLDDSFPLAKEEALGQEFARNAGADSLEALRALPEGAVGAAAAPLIMRSFRTGEGLAFAPNVDGYMLKESPAALREKGQMHRIPYIVGSNSNDMLTSREGIAAGDLGKMHAGVEDFAGTVSQWCPVYAYYFSRQLPGDEAGAFHSAELWYVFGTLGSCWRPMTGGDYALSSEMMDRWVEFMQSGAPGGGWQPSAPGAPAVHRFDIPGVVE